MRTHSCAHILLLAGIFLVGGCSSEPVGPSQVIHQDLRIQVEISPASIERQEVLVARLELENLTDEPVELVSGCSTLALVQTLRAGEMADLRGSVVGCRAMVTSYVIEAGETLTWTYEIRAVRRDEEPVERGLYVLRVEFMVPGLPVLETAFRVR